MNTCGRYVGGRKPTGLKFLSMGGLPMAVAEEFKAAGN
jgi:hypothetical protein